MKSLIVNDTISNCFLISKCYSKTEANKIKNILVSNESYGGDYAITFSTNYAFLFFYKKEVLGSIELSNDTKQISSNYFKIKAINKLKRKHKIHMVGLQTNALIQLLEFCN
jgi:hypothetical protein